MQIQNPNRADALGTLRDPSMLTVGDRYYMVASIPPFWRGFNEGIRLWSSEDLGTFRDEGLLVESAKFFPDKHRPMT